MKYIPCQVWEHKIKRDEERKKVIKYINAVLGVQIIVEQSWVYEVYGQQMVTLKEIFKDKVSMLSYLYKYTMLLLSYLNAISIKNILDMVV